ncbi:MAG: glycosyltransferase [Lachnospiraceae bacterium]|nr:glycosyltransferase [Lachnospiraceae bacterium]
MLLSFVVPVFNAEKYLDECIQSLLEQDIPSDEYEIICINDGSTDDSLKILRTYETQNSNVIVVDKENEGVSAARNAGLDAARGEYVWMVDADDFIQKNCLGGGIRPILKETNCDRLEIGVYAFYGSLSKDETVLYDNKSVSPNAQFYNSSIWNSVFRTEFLRENNLKFAPNVAYGEDTLFMTELNCYVPRKGKLDRALYFYRRNPDSVMAQRSQKARIRIFTSCQNAAIELLQLKRFYDEGINRTDIANAYMTMIWHGVNAICEMPHSERKAYVRSMREHRLFPCKRMDACTLTKSYTTSRTDWIGRMYDWIYVHLHTQSGFWLMCMWRDLEKIKRRR